MRTMTCLLAAASAALLSACGPSLGSVPRSSLSLNPWSPSASSAPEGFSFVFEYDGNAGCLELSGWARATANGTDASEFSRGKFKGFQVPSCDLPSFVFPLEALSEETTIVLEDEGHRVTVVVRNLAHPLSLTVTPPPDGHIRAGSTVGLSWAPSTDRFQPSRFEPYKGFFSGPYGEFFSAPQADGTRINMKIHPKDLMSGTGQFTIPADAPPGEARIEFTGTRTPGVVRCEGVDTCAFDYSLSSNQANPFGTVVATFQIEP